MTTDRVVLICGVATDPMVWTETASRFIAAGFDVDVPERPQSGDLDTEIDFLAPRCTGAIIVGVSGGATLGVELVARGVDIETAFLHEPAAGSLSPGLLDPVASAFDADGVNGFGSKLYGPRWDIAMTSADASTVSRELAMFRAFEPRPPESRTAPVILTVGEQSPAIRRESVRAIAEVCGCEVRILAETSHAAHLDDAYGPVVESLSRSRSTP